MRALLLNDAPEALLRACIASGLAVTRVPDAARGRTLLAHGSYELVDGRIAQPAPLEEEIRARMDAFFERLRDHTSTGLYQTVMREVEKPLIASALERSNGVRSATAQALGIDRGTLARRMRDLGLTAAPADD